MLILTCSEFIRRLSDLHPNPVRVHCSGLVAAERDPQDQHDRVRIAPLTHVCIVVLGIDAPGAGDLVVDGAAEAIGGGPAQ